MSELFKLKPLMVLGTSSGSGKSLTTSAICRLLSRTGEKPFPFKGQNMSNNAWVDKDGGEMAYSQALQAWAAGLEPSCLMNPVLLKPKGNCTSEVIHLGKSVGMVKATNYYEEWIDRGWDAIVSSVHKLKELNEERRLVIEGAGSPVEVNLKHRDITNIRLAKFVKANCLLVADIERGGVFAQIIGTISLLEPEERKLIKGILINKFRGEISLFNEGRKWLENKTGIPVIGVLPYINEVFPPEDSLDLLERKLDKLHTDIEIGVVKFSSISNFSDLDPLEAEPSIKLRWIELDECIGRPDLIILPGSKQTIGDLEKLRKSGLNAQIIDFVNKGGNIFGICGGFQMLGNKLFDPLLLERSNQLKELSFEGLDLIAIDTFFENDKALFQRKVEAFWPENIEIKGFELHHGISKPIVGRENELQQISNDKSLGWLVKGSQIIGGTYLHGIFDNGIWRRSLINKLRCQKGIRPLKLGVEDYDFKREYLLDLLADHFEKYVDLSPLL